MEQTETLGGHSGLSWPSGCRITWCIVETHFRCELSAHICANVYLYVAALPLLDLYLIPLFYNRTSFKSMLKTMIWSVSGGKVEEAGVSMYHLHVVVCINVSSTYACLPVYINVSFTCMWLPVCINVSSTCCCVHQYIIYINVFQCV